MAIGTPVERKALTSFSSQTTTTAFSPASTMAAGTFQLLMCTSNQSKTASSVADSVGGNTWAVDYAVVGLTFGISFVSCQVVTPITSSDTITITWSAATSSLVQAGVQEISGIATSSAFDKSKNTASSSSPTAPTTGASATLSQANEIVFGCFRCANSTAWAHGTGYSDVTTPYVTATSIEYKIVAATTAVTADGTATSCTSYNAALATYKGASATAFVPKISMFLN